MSVITISRGSFSGGKRLAESVAKRLNYRCIDRDVLAQRIAIRGVSPDELLAALDTPSLSRGSTLNHRKYLYLALIQAAITEEISSGDAVYHGLAGHLLLQGRLEVLRIRVIAPLDHRIHLVQDELGLSRLDAVAHIEKVDDERSKWTRYLYGVDWEDPSLYDLVINLQHLCVEQACSFVCSVAEAGGFESLATPQTSLDDFVLAARVRAALARDPLTRNLEVDVESAAGAITIKGELCEQTEDVERIVTALPGVRKLSFLEPQLATTAEDAPGPLGHPEGCGDGPELRVLEAISL